MAAPRATQFIALRNLALARLKPTPRVRNLHMTAAATRSSSAASESVKTTSTASSSSTPIDFAFLPSADVLSETTTSSGGNGATKASAVAAEILRVPVMPSVPSTTRTAAAAAVQGHSAEGGGDHVIAEVMKPQISSMAADAVFAPFADADSHSHEHDDGHTPLQKPVETTTAVQAEPSGGIVRQVWRDMVEDVMGRGKGGVVG